MNHKHVKRTIEAFFGIDDIFSKSRERKYIEARGFFNKILYDSGLTQQQVSDLSKMERTTVLFSLNNTNNLIELYEPYRTQYEEIVKSLDDDDFSIRTIELRSIIDPKRGILNIESDLINWFSKYHANIQSNDAN
jgi:hypothetical protein